MGHVSPSEAELLPPAEQAAVAALLSMLHERTGIDFRQYREATVHRRIRNRMVNLGVRTFEEYLELARSSASEPMELLQRITIKVSRFYRNSVVFDQLRQEILPRLAAERRGGLRVWSAGCGCGEEAYTLAMLLDELGCPGIVDATDVDTAALVAAAHGVYPAAASVELPEDLAARYLEPFPGRRPSFRVVDRLRPLVRCARHDLTSDMPAATPGPEGGFDLVCCRNVLIYLQPAAQVRVLQHVCTALAAHGVLCLGEAEWPHPAFADSLVALGHRGRMFRAAQPREGVS